MSKKEQILISFGAITGGFVLCGFAMTGTYGQLISTLCIVFGLGFSVGGFVSLILALKKPALKDEDETLPPAGR